MARRTTQPRELVRLSPLQFSLSISVVVILLGAAALAGYFYGLKQAVRSAAEAVPSGAFKEGMKSDQQAEGSDAAVTFYSALTEPRQNPPTFKPPEPVKPAVEPVAEKPISPSAAASEVREPPPEGLSLLLQVASYKDQTSAQRLLKELSADGYAGTIVRADLGERGVWFRVRVGPYGTQKEAGSVLERLRKERSLKGYIVK